METAKTTEIATRPANGVPPAPPAAPLPQENYLNGFEGMATAPFDGKIVEILRAPIPEMDVEIKPDGIVYLPGIFYRQRLMDAFGPGGWSIAPRSPAKRGAASGGELVMYHGALWCLGRYVSEAVGQCVYYPNNFGMTYADAFEGAKTDCITRCCKDLGIARELWDPTWRAQWQDKYAVKVKKEVKGQLKEVWERKGREQKLAASPPAAKPSAPPASSARTAAGSATTAAPTSDDGEAMTPGDLADLEGLIRELKWKKQFTGWWFKRRFGVAHSAVTKSQFATACKLLLAFSLGPDKYGAELAAQASAGKCAGAGDDEVTKS